MIQGVSLRIVGLSNGTNAMVIQYAFVTLSRAQAIVGFPGLISFVAARVRAGMDENAATAALRAMIRGRRVVAAWRSRPLPCPSSSRSRTCQTSCSNQYQECWNLP
jgi:hypothetical protein